MKKLLVLLLALLSLLPAAQAEKLPDLWTLTGLDAMQEALANGAELIEIVYDTGTKIERGYTLTDPDEMNLVLSAVLDLQIADVTDLFVTDMYPSLHFHLDDGSQYTLAFDGKWLEADGVNYVLANDEMLWQVLRDYSDQYAPPLPERYIPNSVDLYLPANPTAGYAWSWAADEPFVVSVTEQYFADSAELGLAGAGGTHWFHFDGLHPGTTAVTLTYGRSWEEEPASRITYRITVRDQLDVMIWGVEMQ